MLQFFMLHYKGKQLKVHSRKRKKLTRSGKLNNIPKVLRRCGIEHIEDDRNKFLFTSEHKLNAIFFLSFFLSFDSSSRSSLLLNSLIKSIYMVSRGQQASDGLLYLLFSIFNQRVFFLFIGVFPRYEYHHRLSRLRWGIQIAVASRWGFRLQLQFECYSLKSRKSVPCL